METKCFYLCLLAVLLCVLPCTSKVIRKCRKFDYIYAGCTCEESFSDNNPQIICSYLTESQLRRALKGLDQPIGELYLVYYKGDKLPEKFLYGKTVEKFRLESNKKGLQLTDKIFLGVQGTTSIGFDKVNLTAIDSRLFLSLTDLYEISIVNSPSVESVDLDLSTLPNLDSLQLNNNNISHISKPVFHPDIQTKSVSLNTDGNPLICDCGLHWLWSFEWNWESNTALGVCSDPVELEGIKIRALTNCTTCSTYQCRSTGNTNRRTLWLVAITLIILLL